MWFLIAQSIASDVFHSCEPPIALALSSFEKETGRKKEDVSGQAVILLKLTSAIRN